MTDCDHRTQRTNKATGEVRCEDCGERLVDSLGLFIAKRVEQKLFDDL